MKYFLPELHLRMQPPPEPFDRDAAWPAIEAAMAEWDRAEDDYEAELKRDWDRFPEAVRWYLDNVRLHDGVVIADGPADDDQYRLVARTENPDGEYIEFVYSLLEPPQVLDAGFPDDLKSPAPHLMYDEFEADPGSAAPRFTHSILFSNGRELRVRFSDVEIRRFAPLLTAASA